MAVGIGQSWLVVAGNPAMANQWNPLPDYVGNSLPLDAAFDPKTHVGGIWSARGITPAIYNKIRAGKRIYFYVNVGVGSSMRMAYARPPEAKVKGSLDDVFLVERIIRNAPNYQGAVKTLADAYHIITSSPAQIWMIIAAAATAGAMSAYLAGGAGGSAGGAVGGVAPSQAAPVAANTAADVAGAQAGAGTALGSGVPSAGGSVASVATPQAVGGGVGSGLSTGEVLTVGGGLAKAAVPLVGAGLAAGAQAKKQQGANGVPVVGPEGLTPVKPDNAMPILLIAAAAAAFLLM